MSARRASNASPDLAPRAHLLSNGTYSVLVTDVGSGFSAFGRTLLSGWSGDRTEDAEGLFVYLRDLEDGATWSAGLQPSPARGDAYAVSTAPGRVRIDRRDRGIATRLECWVDSSRHAEVRRLTLENRSRVPRSIEITVYAELVLQTLAGHLAHPAFSKLFVQTEHLPGEEVLVASRRPRSRSEAVPWLAVTLSGPGRLQHETDRARFIGRGRSLRSPAALDSREPLSGTIGSVLDPVAALRRVVSLAPAGRASIDLVLAFGDSREQAVSVLRSLRRPRACTASRAAAGRREREVRRRLGLTGSRAESLQRIAGGMLYADPRLRAPAAILRRCKPGGADFAALGLRNSALHGVAQVSGPAGRLVRELTEAQAYWRACGLSVDLLLLCATPARLLPTLEAERRRLEEPEAVIVARDPRSIDRDDLDRLKASADLYVNGALPSIPYCAPDAGNPSPDHYRLAPEDGEGADDGETLDLDNGYGGFAADGRDYVIRVGPRPGDRPPTPWINVLANESFGFLASESGSTYTWNENSRQNRITPWSNDPVSDPHGEALYLRDDDARTFWSPLPGPAGAGGVFTVRHGFDRSLWSHESRGLRQEVLAFAPRHDPVKITVVTLRNLEDRPRRLSLVSFSRLVLGVLPRPSVVTEIDPDSGILLARSPFRDEFPEGVSFAATAAPKGARTRITSDRTRFLGRNGSMDAPAEIVGPSSTMDRGGAGHDACAAIDVEIRLAPRGIAECVFLLGETASPAAARALVARYRRRGAWARALAEVGSFWDETRGAIEVSTPSAAIDRMLNGWLLHQLLSCRLWGRSAFYQSGGAFGFRDQLQDSAALVYARPDLMRAQLLLHAAHQFVEGDVLHWWHTPSGRGTRTRCSDDLLWLPYLATFYAQTTGDWSVFDDRAGYVTARPLTLGEDETFLQAEPCAKPTDLYQHCCLAIDRSLGRGVHGLPLIGTCDWNDGMNRVGREGRGESVWLAFFLAAVLEAMVPLCERRGDTARAERYRRHHTELAAAVESTAWDGAWYRRAFYDDGTPLGSSENDECRIDALAQSWAVISRLVPEDRAREAMAAADRELVREDDGLIRLLTPPFDHTRDDPGYIKGYVPGIRENGGQYTHGALWVVRALAELGERNRAARLLEMLTPVAHASTRARADVYKVEPYVVAADVYGAPPHVGRGGWTWYTGSAAWMYRVALESVLGFTIEDGKRLRIAPCVPDAWPELTLRYRSPNGSTRYEIHVANPDGQAARVVGLDAGALAGSIEDGVARVTLVDDGRLHRVRVTLGAEPASTRPSSPKR